MVEGRREKEKGKGTSSNPYLCDPFPRFYDLEQRDHKPGSGRVGGVLQVALGIRASGRGGGAEHHHRSPIAANGRREEREDFPRGQGLARLMLGSAARRREHVVHSDG